MSPVKLSELKRVDHLGCVLDMRLRLISCLADERIETAMLPRNSLCPRSDQLSRRRAKFRRQRIRMKCTTNACQCDP